MRELSIGGRVVGASRPPFVVAEMSGNHNQSLERALAIVDAAADAGADGLKLQTYTAETMTLDLDRGAFRIDDPKSLWAGRTLFDLYREASTPWEWHAPILARCRERGLIGFSTPFDESAVDFLESLAAPCYKIASFECTDLPLVQKAAATGKPLIISTGMATEEEIGETVAAARAAGGNDLILLKCTSSYPASPENTNLATIPVLAKRFGCQVGLSDHTQGTAVAIASVGLGATFVEKHFTLRRSDGGVDAQFSLEPAELAALVAGVRQAHAALGTAFVGPTPAEVESLAFRRSLYVAQDMRAGDVFTPVNLRRIRPGLGLAPKYWHEVLGQKAARDIERGTPLSWDLVV